jgi:hypothetical protein
MIFGNRKSDVRNHLSTHHSLLAHRRFVDDEPVKLTSQLRDEENPVEGTAPAKGEEPEVVQPQR